MKLLFLMALVLVVMSLESVSEAGVDLKVEMTAVKTLTELATLAETQLSERRRERGCEIQLREKIPPTLCYHSAADPSELDFKCKTLSRTAIRLPRADRFTSAACKTALEKRAGDLAYAR